MFVRSPFNYSSDDASVASGYSSDDVSVTKQSFKDEADINTIVRKFGVTGSVPVTALEPQYGDFSGVNDYHDAMNRLIAAQATFDAVPAHIRKEFDNDPAQFVEFVGNPENSDKLREWGFIQESVAPNVAPLNVVLDAIKSQQVTEE